MWTFEKGNFTASFMTLIPDVPVAIVLIHFVALSGLMTHIVIVRRRLRAFRRQNRSDTRDTL